MQKVITEMCVEWMDNTVYEGSTEICKYVNFEYKSSIIEQLAIDVNHYFLQTPMQL